MAGADRAGDSPSAAQDAAGDIAARTEALFIDLLALEPASQVARLSELKAAGEPDAVLREVASLLDCSTRDFMKADDLAKLATDAMDWPLDVGDTFGDVVVLSRLGAGGMGVVYKARQQQPSRDVALKVIRPWVAQTEGLERISREAELQARISHPNVAQIFAVRTQLQADGRALSGIVMELVDGDRIDHACRQRGLAIPQVLDLFLQACDAVAHAHSSGIIHRDLKPGNIFVTADSRVKVLDFGIAGPIGVPSVPADGVLGPVAGDASPEASFGTGTLAASRSSGLRGTPDYISPEAFATGLPVDARGDVYALGVVLHELLTGQLPRRRHSGGSSPQAQPSSAAAKLPRDLQAILQTALEADPDRRYQSVLNLATDIRHHLHHRPISVRQDSALYVFQRLVRRHRVLAGVAVLLSTALLAAAIVAVSQSQKAEAALLAEAIAGRQAVASLEVAKNERDRADTAARSLRDRLLTADLERGRLVADSGAREQAERIIWPRVLENAADPRALWAMRSLTFGGGCFLTQPLPEGEGLAIARTADEFAIATDKGNVLRIGRDGEVKWRSSSPASPLGVWFLSERMDEHILGLDRRGSLLVIDAETGDFLERRAITAGGKNLLNRAIMRMGSSEVIIGGPDGKLRIFRRGMFRWEPAETISICTSSIYRLAATPTSTPSQATIAVGTDGGEVIMLKRSGRHWQSTARWTAHAEAAGRPATLAALTFTENGTLVTGGSERTIAVWNFTTGQRLQRIDTRNGTIRGLILTGNLLVQSGWWTTIVWSVDSDGLLERKLDLPGGAMVAAATQDGAVFATASADKVRLWNPMIGRAVTQLPQLAGAIRFRQSPNGTRIAAASSRSGTILIMPADGSPAAVEAGTRAFDSVLQLIRDIAWLDNNRLVVTGSGATVIIDVDSGQLERHPFKSGFGSVVASLGGNFLVASTPLGLELKSSASLSNLIERPVPTTAETVCIVAGPNVQGRPTAIVLRRTTSIELLDADTLEPIAAQASTGHVWRAAVSPDGKILAIGTWAPSIELYTLPDLKPAGVLLGHGQLINELKFTPDGTLLSVSGDGTLRAWHTAHQACTASLRLSEGSVSGLEIVGPHVFVGGEFGQLFTIDTAALDAAAGGSRDSWLHASNPAGPP